MSAELATKLKNNPSTTDHKNAVDVINSRRSQELIIGICGAIGAGSSELDRQLQESLDLHGYEIEKIKISDLIFKIRNDPSRLSGIIGYDKYYNFQDAGNEIRQKAGNDYLSKAAVEEIIDKRKTHTTEEGKTDKKVAYILNQLKHPDEVTLLRAIYKQNFYLIGINSTEESRKRNLENQGIDKKHIDDLIIRDRKQEEVYGQQVEKTFFLSDYFIHNQQNSGPLKDAIERFIDLVHGVNGKTPTKDEKGMYEAFSASLQSACLSRQVGAAIMDEKGDILATGCNDVPVYGGGLYNAEHGKKDQRCVFKGKKCYNDLHKGLLEKRFEEILSDHSIEKANDIAKELLGSSKAKDLIEYSRAIHAEMASIMQLARATGQSAVGTTLYCTTYPCHNCARHIVAAGIHKVIYIEPYEKSLALQLHDDAITHNDSKNKVRFEPFQGVSPERYLKFFLALDDRKDNGVAVIKAPKDSYHVDSQYLDSYHAYEDKVIEIKDLQGKLFGS